MRNSQRIVAKTLEKDREDRYQTTRELMVDLRRLMKKETERSPVGAVKAKDGRGSGLGLSLRHGSLRRVAWIALTGRSGPPILRHCRWSSSPFRTKAKVPRSSRTDRAFISSADTIPVEMSVKGGEAVPLRAAIGTMSILDISPDGSEFLLLQSDLNDETQRGTIWTMPVLGGAAKRLGNVTARGASYSPDGKLIAFNEKESVYVCDADGQKRKADLGHAPYGAGQSFFFAGL